MIGCLDPRIESRIDRGDSYIDVQWANNGFAISKKLNCDLKKSNNLIKIKLRFNLYPNNMPNIMQVQREDYLSLLRSGKDRNDVIKVITGMRRAGKSTLLDQFIKILKNQDVPDDRIFLMNFERLECQYITDHRILNQWISDNVPKEGQC